MFKNISTPRTIVGSVLITVGATVLVAGIDYIVDLAFEKLDDLQRSEELVDELSAELADREDVLDHLKLVVIPNLEAGVAVAESKRDLSDKLLQQNVKEMRNLQDLVNSMRHEMSAMQNDLDYQNQTVEDLKAELNKHRSPGKTSLETMEEARVHLLNTNSH